MAREVGLDLEQFEGHRTGEAVKAKVRSDIDLGLQLGVDATPSIFLNGRRVYDLRENSLEVLIVNVAGKRP